MRPAFTKSFDEGMDLLSDPTLGNFFTDAVRPRQSMPMIDRYKITHIRQPDGFEVPTLIASLSREKLYDVFLEMVGTLKSEVVLMIHTSHDLDDHENPVELQRDEIELFMVESWLANNDFENFLTHDGCIRVSVCNEDSSCQIDLDEHKLLYVFANMKSAVRILERRKIARRDAIKVVSAVPHVHFTADEFEDELRRFKEMTGMENWNTRDSGFDEDDDLLSI